MPRVISSRTAAAAAAAGRNHRALNSAISGRFARARAHDPRGLAAMASHARGTHRHARHDVGGGGSSACVHVYHRGPISFFPYRVDLRRSMQ
uniref:Uncharacterized protein n=1 Tax=Trichogramma kaykai TaxID=54128 RepID=A0ABD2X1Q2_9HYME